MYSPCITARKGVTAWRWNREAACSIRYVHETCLYAFECSIAQPHGVPLTYQLNKSMLYSSCCISLLESLHAVVNASCDFVVWCFSILFLSWADVVTSTFRSGFYHHLNLGFSDTLRRVMVTFRTPVQHQSAAELMAVTDNSGRYGVWIHLSDGRVQLKTMGSTGLMQELIVGESLEDDEYHAVSAVIQDHEIQLTLDTGNSTITDVLPLTSPAWDMLVSNIELARFSTPVAMAAEEEAYEPFSGWLQEVLVNDDIRPLDMLARSSPLDALILSNLSASIHLDATNIIEMRSLESDAIHFNDTTDGFYIERQWLFRKKGYLTFHLKTLQDNAILAYQQGAANRKAEGDGDNYAALIVSNGSIALSYHNGDEMLEAVSSLYISDGLWHEVGVRRDKHIIYFQVDGALETLTLRHHVVILAFPEHEQLLIGAVPAGVEVNGVSEGFMGCMRHFYASGSREPVQLRNLTTDISDIVPFCPSCEPASPCSVTELCVEGQDEEAYMCEPIPTTQPPTTTPAPTTTPPPITTLPQAEITSEPDMLPLPPVLSSSIADMTPSASPVSAVSTDSTPMPTPVSASPTDYIYSTIDPVSVTPTPVQLVMTTSSHLSIPVTSDIIDDAITSMGLSSSTVVITASADIVPTESSVISTEDIEDVNGTAVVTLATVSATSESVSGVEASSSGLYAWDTSYWTEPDVVVSTSSVMESSSSEPVSSSRMDADMLPADTLAPSASTFIFSSESVEPSQLMPPPSKSIIIMTPESSVPTPSESMMTPESSVPTPSETIMTPESSVPTPSESMMTPESSVPTPSETIMTPVPPMPTSSESAVSSAVSSMPTPSESIMSHASSSMPAPSESIMTPESSVPTPSETIMTPESSVPTPSESMMTPESSIPTPSETIMTPAPPMPTSSESAVSSAVSSMPTPSESIMSHASSSMPAPSESIMTLVSSMPTPSGSIMTPVSSMPTSSKSSVSPAPSMLTTSESAATPVSSMPTPSESLSAHSSSMSTPLESKPVASFLPSELTTVHSVSVTPSYSDPAVIFSSTVLPSVTESSALTPMLPPTSSSEASSFPTPISSITSLMSSMTPPISSMTSSTSSMTSSTSSMTSSTSSMTSSTSSMTSSTSSMTSLTSSVTLPTPSYDPTVSSITSYESPVPHVTSSATHVISSAAHVTSSATGMSSSVPHMISPDMSAMDSREIPMPAASLVSSQMEAGVSSSSSPSMAASSISSAPMASPGTTVLPTTQPTTQPVAMTSIPSPVMITSEQEQTQATPAEVKPSTSSQEPTEPATTDSTPSPTTAAATTESPTTVASEEPTRAVAAEPLLSISSPDAHVNLPPLTLSADKPITLKFSTDKGGIVLYAYGGRGEAAGSGGDFAGLAIMPEHVLWQFSVDGRLYNVTIQSPPGESYYTDKSWYDINVQHGSEQVTVDVDGESRTITGSNLAPTLDGGTQLGGSPGNSIGDVSTGYTGQVRSVQVGDEPVDLQAVAKDADGVEFVVPPSSGNQPVSASSAGTVQPSEPTTEPLVAETGSGGSGLSGGAVAGLVVAFVIIGVVLLAMVIITIIQVAGRKRGMFKPEDAKLIPMTASHAYV